MDIYNINDVALMSGLSTRTIREYIKAGFLTGEKTDGAWQFTDEAVSELFSNKAVLPSIRAKKNAIIYDFMLDDNKKDEEMCSIVDFPSSVEGAAEISDFFCKKINSGRYCDIRFSFEHRGKNARVILKGPAEVVLKILSQYYHRKSTL